MPREKLCDLEQRLLKDVPNNLEYARRELAEQSGLLARERDSRRQQQQKRSWLSRWSSSTEDDTPSQTELQLETTIAELTNYLAEADHWREEVSKVVRTLDVFDTSPPTPELAARAYELCQEYNTRRQQLSRERKSSSRTWDLGDLYFAAGNWLFERSQELKHEAARHVSAHQGVPELSRLSPQQPVTVRLLPSPDDPVSFDTTLALLSAIHHSRPTAELTFSLIATATDVSLTCTLASSFLPRFEQLLATYFPHCVLEPADEPPPAIASVDYRSAAVHTALPSFRELSTDPFALFCTFADTLQQGQQLRFSTTFIPAPEFFLTAYQKAVSFVPEEKALAPWMASFCFTVHSAAEKDPSRVHALTEQFERTYLKQYVIKWGELLPWRHDGTRRKFLSSFSAVDKTLPLPEMERIVTTYREFGEHLWTKHLLSTEELTGFIHLPHKSVTSPLLQRANTQSQKAPDTLTKPDSGLLLGVNEHRRQSRNVYLPHDQRSRHIYLLGASGSGKSTLLKNLIKQDIETGCGLAVIDPHGDLVNDTLPLIPASRVTDTVLIDMANTAHPVSLNPFCVSPEERSQATDEFVLVFERMFLQDAARAKHILYFTVAVMLEAGTTTPLDIEAFLTSRRFRTSLLDRLTTPRLIRFVEEEFEKYEKAVDPIVNKLARFSIKPEVGAMLGQAKSNLNLYAAMQQKKILLLKLMPERQEDSQLIGALLVSQIQLAAMRRNQLPMAQRVPFSLYIDEFQNFMSGGAEAFAKILSEARKYNLCLVLAHQYMSQLDDAVRTAIFANTQTRIFFRTSPQDAHALRTELASFTPEQLAGLPRGQAIAALKEFGHPFMLSTAPPPAAPAQHHTAAIVEHTRATYSTRTTAPPHEQPQQRQPVTPAAEAPLTDKTELEDSALEPAALPETEPVSEPAAETAARAAAAAADTVTTPLEEPQASPAQPEPRSRVRMWKTTEPAEKPSPKKPPVKNIFDELPWND